MRRRAIRLLAAFTLAAATVPALAGTPYEGGARTEPGREVARPPVRRAPAGLFDCFYREQRTKLERKNCGGTRF